MRRGFTLIELTVAIFIAVLVTTGLVTSLSALDSAKARQAAGQVSAAVRECFDRAALSGSVHRMVFDVGGRSFRVELAQGVFSLPAVPQEISREGEVEVKEEDDFEDRLGGLSDEAIAGLKALRQPPSWQPVDGELGSGVELAGTQVLTGFWSDTYDQFVKKGEAALYFFPRGETQDAVFWIGGKDDETMSVRVDGLAARVAVRFGRIASDGRVL
jgi:general secretion pathway protein H